MCVIADDAGVLGLGGIMGGEASGSTEATVDVLIESAWFEPNRTARTGRRVGINSDARYRFERGVDPAFVVKGLELATRLVMELCGGEPSEIVVAGAEPVTRKDRRLPAVGGEAPVRARSFGRADHRDAGGARFSVEGLGEAGPWWCRPGGRTSMARPIWWKRSCASPASTR